MNDTTAPDERADAARLDGLRQQTVEARETLARVQQDVADAEGALSRTHAAQLRDGSELDEASGSAERDALTALPNRALLLDRFEQAIALHGATARAWRCWSWISTTSVRSTIRSASRPVTRCFNASLNA